MYKFVLVFFYFEIFVCVFVRFLAVLSSMHGVEHYCTSAPGSLLLLHCAFLFVCLLASLLRNRGAAQDWCNDGLPFDPSFLCASGRHAAGDESSHHYLLIGRIFTFSLSFSASSSSCSFFFLLSVVSLCLQHMALLVRCSDCFQEHGIHKAGESLQHLHRSDDYIFLFSDICCLFQSSRIVFAWCAGPAASKFLESLGRDPLFIGVYFLHIMLTPMVVDVNNTGAHACICIPRANNNNMIYNIDV